MLTFKVYIYFFVKGSSKSEEWKKLVSDILITEREQLLWRAQGLPADTESFIGAARSLKGSLVPLFMDSTGVAVKWLRSNIGSNLEVTRPEDSKFLTSVELAVRFGKSLLIEEIIDLPSVLLPLLRKRSLRLGDRTLPLQQGFQLFLATREESLKNLPSEADAVLIKIALGTGTKSFTERLVEKVFFKTIKFYFI